MLAGGRTVTRRNISRTTSSSRKTANDNNDPYVVISTRENRPDGVFVCDFQRLRRLTYGDNARSSIAHNTESKSGERRGRAAAAAAASRLQRYYWLHKSL